MPRHADAQGGRQRDEPQGRSQEKRLAVEADRNGRIRANLELTGRPLPKTTKAFVLARCAERDELREVGGTAHSGDDDSELSSVEALARAVAAESVPLLLTGVVYVVLMRLGVVPELRDLERLAQRIGFFLTVLMMGMAIGAAWEIVEWTLDSTTGSHLIISSTDTATDLIWDTIGSAGSATILVLWSLGNHSLRRRPGIALAHKPFGSFLKASTR